MAESQVGTTDTLFTIAKGRDLGAATPTSYNSSNEHVTNCIIHEGYIYTSWYKDTSSSAATKVKAIYRRLLSDPNGNWELITSGIWNVDSGTYSYNSPLGWDGTRLYCLAGSYQSGGQGNRGYSAYFDIANIVGGWKDGAITNLADDSYVFGTYGGIVCDSRYVMLFGSSNTTGHPNAGLVMISKSNLTGSWKLSSMYSACFKGCTAVVYEDEVYFIGGTRATGNATRSVASGLMTYCNNSGGSSSVSVMKYNSLTDVWTSNVLPTIPSEQYGQYSACVVGKYLYLINTTSNLYHYCDMSLGASATWIQLIIPPFVCGGAGSVSYNPATRRLYCIDHDGILHYLQLGVNNLPTGEYWDSETIGLVSTVSVDSGPNCAFDMSLVSLDTHANTTPNVAFDITSTAQVITSITAVASDIPIPILVSNAIGKTGVISLNTPDVSFTFDSYSMDEELGGSDIVFTIQSVGNGNSYEDVEQLESLDTIFELESSANGILGVVGIGSSNFAISSSGNGVVNLSQIGHPSISFDITVEAQGSTNIGSTVVVVVPFQIQSFASGEQISPSLNVIYPEPTVDAWSVNCRNGGHSQYTNYLFNDFFKLKGILYGVNERGIVRLSGDTDNGTHIEAYLSTGVTDFNTNKKKNIANSYVDVRADGDLVIQLNADEQTNRRGYRIVHDLRNGLHRRRVKSAKGIKATNWQFELGNTKGCDFEVNSIEVDAVAMQRAI